MFMIFINYFLLNVFCAVYNCNYEHPVPTPGPNDLIKSRKLINVNTIVNTSNGAVDGFVQTVFGGRDIFAFEGIPYAEPPIRNLRFRAPVPKLPWMGIRSAKAPSKDCLQFNLGRASGFEDCLYLNVYTPLLPLNNENLNIPVIIWIHGGSFMLGAGRQYGASYLLNRDVILVTINYRLGVLGFMSTGDEESPGNYGLKDQALAIKWVHDNIEYFGGDKDRVSLMGQSSGAASVQFHIISPTSAARGYFQSAASLSGSVFCPWALQTPKYAHELTARIAKLVACPVRSGSKALVDCLRSTNPNLLVAYQWQLFSLIMFPVVLFGPVIEPNITGAIIIDTPENYYARNEVAKIPWLVTSTENEAEFVFQLFKIAQILISVLADWRRTMPVLLDLYNKVDNYQYVLEKVVKSYMGNQDPAYADSRLWAQVATDRYYTVPIRRAIKFHSKIAPTYSYMYGFTNKIGITGSVFFDDYRKWGASHVDDLVPIFNSSQYLPALKKGEPIYELSNIVTNLLTNFAAKGAPYYTTVNGSDVVIWEPIHNPNKPRFLRLNSGDIKMIPDPFAERLKIWTSLGVR